MSDDFMLAPLWSWQEFLDAATQPPTSSNAGSRADSAEWAGCSWEEAVRLGRDGWPQVLDDVDVTVAELRDHTKLDRSLPVLEPSWDVTGSEVDVGAFLSGVPECMIETTPQRMSRVGKVVTFVIPTFYLHTVCHERIINRGLALATLCVAIIDAGHSVEIWSGNTGQVDDRRFCAMIRVISAGEPLDVGRLIFATAHPAMCRRLSFGLWDAQPRPIAEAMAAAAYGRPPYDCRPEDMPTDITDPYIFPYLDDSDRQWDLLPQALEWCNQMFVDLGLIEGVEQL